MSESIATTLKKGNKLLYPATYYNQVIMPDGSRWNGIIDQSSGVKSVNGKTGTVTLNASDIGAAPSSHSHDRLINGNYQVRTYSSTSDNRLGILSTNTSASDAFYWMATDLSATAKLRYILYKNGSSVADGYVYTTLNKPTPADIGAATLGGADEYFYGIHLGATRDALPYIYTANENINFRYKDPNGTLQYANINDIIYGISSKAPANHTHDALQGSNCNIETRNELNYPGINILGRTTSGEALSFKGSLRFSLANMRNGYPIIQQVNPESTSAATVYSSANPPTYSEVGAAAASHTHNIIINGNNTLGVSPDSSNPYFTLTKSGIAQLAIQKLTGNYTTAALHWYDESNGAWKSAGNIWSTANLTYSLSGSTLTITTK